MKGFSRIASPKKSLRQQLKKVFKSINKRGNKKHGHSAIRELEKESQYVTPGTGNFTPGEIPASGNQQVQASKEESIGKDDCIWHEEGGSNRVFESAPECGAGSGNGLRSEGLSSVHWQELDQSCIDEEIAALNFKSLDGDEAYEYLIYSDKISRRNDGRLRDAMMRRYAHLAEGGWWCSGVDIINGEDSLWGCFKPNQPRIDEGKGKAIKYEHPPKIQTEIFALKIPARLWELISRRYDVALPENYQSLPHRAFWQWVKANSKIPVIICEGAKKAAAILSCGYVAIALPGIYGGFRQPKDDEGNHTGLASLIPQLAAIATEGRRMYFCFDQDSKRKTVRAVNFALGRTANLLKKRKCLISVMSWHPALGKGIDDVISACGREQFDTLYREACPLDNWETKQLKKLTYVPDLSLNQRYLGELAIPSGKQLIALKSPKGTGKSYLLKYLTDPVVRSGERRVLIITHRIQLGLQLCENIGVPMITEVRQTGQGSHLGMGLCINSLHPKSQAKFNPDEWKGCWLILDEVQQLIWELLSSSTCQKDRVSIIKTFKQLLLNVVNYGGEIFIADADLNDIGIDFIKGLLGQDVDTFLVENTFKFSEPWDVKHFKQNNPAQLIRELEIKLSNGQKHFVCCSGQKAKSRWGSYNLEKHFQKLFPELKILRIDSKTVVDSGHPAYGCIPKLNEIIKDYDLVISTSTIETGVSIEEKHFDGVWGIFQGIQTADSVRQHLSRYRPPVPRYIWLSKVGINRAGSGSSIVSILLSGENKKDAANIRRLSATGFEETIDNGFDSICVTTWGKFGAIINAGMNRYSEQILEDLKAEGHNILAEVESLITEEEIKETKQRIDENCDVEYSTHRVKVSDSESLTDERFERLDKQNCKTEKEQLEHEKGTIERLYNVPVTPELIHKHDNGWHSQIRLHYLFGKGREFLADRDKNIMSRLLESGGGDYFKPDTNKSLIGNKIGTLDKIKLGELLELQEMTNDTPLLVEIFDKIKAQVYNAKLLLGVDFSKVDTPIKAAQRLLAMIGYKIPFLRKQGKRGQQLRVYGQAAAEFQRGDDGKIILVDGVAVPISDGRDEVFEAWLKRDELAREKALQAKEDAKAAAMAIQEQAAALEQARLDAEIAYRGKPEDNAQIFRDYLVNNNLTFEMIEDLTEGWSQAFKSEVWACLTTEERKAVHALKEEAIANSEVSA